MKPFHNCTYFRVAGIGEILWDMLPEGKRLGGAPANFALHAQALGAQAAIISSLGKDDAGLEILRRLNNAAVNTEYIQMNGHPTGWVDVDVCSRGLPAYVIHKGVAWDHIECSPEIEAAAESFDAVCYGTLAQRTAGSSRAIHSFLASTRPECIRVFDMNLRQNFYTMEIIEASLHAATVLKLNDDELKVLQNMFDLPESTEAALKTLLKNYQLDTIAFTQGAAGSILMDRNLLSHCSAPTVAVKDTVGAGDAFTAAVVMSKLHGISLHKTNQFASKIAAYVCSQAGAVPKLPQNLVAEIKREMVLSIPNIIESMPKDKNAMKPKTDQTV